MTENTQQTKVLKGIVRKITYKNSQNGYTVAVLHTGDEEITVVGSMPFVNTGDDLEVFGDYIVHPVYGRQFKAETVNKNMPTDAAAILRYLSTGVIKGVGPSTSRKIVEAFGEDTMRILESSPQELSKIKGISNEKAKAIGEEFLKQFGIRDVMLLLNRFKISTEDSIKVYKTLGSATIAKIESNPYILCNEAIDLSFEKAEDIANYYNIPSDNKMRICAGVEYVLRKNTYNGHTCLPKNKLVAVSTQLLETKQELVEEAVEELLCSLILRSKNCQDGEYIALNNQYCAEEYIAVRLSNINSQKKPYTVDDREILYIQQQMGITLDEKQHSAVKKAFENGIMLLTGGPGTGKTTTLKAMIEMFNFRDMKIELAAPTGRAAKRMTELTGHEAKTIHRLLEAEWSDDGKLNFCRNEQNQLDCDVIIVDEVSMIDSVLFEKLLRALRLSCRIILVGDTDQLPSVSAGNVLGDIIDSLMFEVVRLDKVFRQAQSSAIIRTAHTIIAGEKPDLSVKDSDFFFMHRINAEDTADTVVALCSERLPSAYGFDSIKDIQILSPSRKMSLGTMNLNNLLQQCLNPKKEKEPELFFKGYYLRENDKVMQIKNNYELTWTKDNGEEGSGVYNGDVGYIEKINIRAGVVTVRYEDKRVDYLTEELSQIELAYAVTVHKSQGSEFDCVILPLFDVPSKLRYRNLLYTAVTRAKKLLIAVGSQQVFYAMAENNKKTLRYTLLKDFLWDKL